MMLRRTGDELGRVLDNTLDEAGAQDLVPAFEAGLVDLDPLGATGDDDEALFDHIVAHLQRRLTELVSETETSYPLFDDEAGGLLRAMVEEGHVPNPDFQLANEVGMARSFITGLDAFPTPAWTSCWTFASVCRRHSYGSGPQWPRLVASSKLPRLTRI